MRKSINRHKIYGHFPKSSKQASSQMWNDESLLDQVKLWKACQIKHNKKKDVEDDDDEEEEEEEEKNQCMPNSEPLFVKQQPNEHHRRRH
ncbi:hypothetical protein T4B_10015 [Trichinella pseudospiralis]|uniref:Uncharacterized protein n=1 Tax=Trichinella pseudospiralis TaxID=6337 RepID=A0A0V1K528_TRIPS|nr:hypothetical protein T4B_10015 [Trichinella pseudospiralis]KRZ42168.1 hypothetical protein T4C_11234 [Trichinella pseudospiralis]